MSANKTIEYIDDIPFKTTEYKDVVTGLSAGAHIYKNELYDSANVLIDTKIINFTKESTNTAPITGADSYVMNEDTTLTTTTVNGVLSNDSDSDGDTLTAELVSPTSNGLLTFNTDGTFTYTPNADYFGADSFVYRVFDGTAYSANRTVDITINVVAASATFDPDYQAVLDAVTANGDPLPSVAQQDVDNQYMIDYKATGGYIKDDAFFKFKGVGFGTGLIGYRLMDWKRLIKAIPYGGLVWSDEGVKANGTNAYIDPLYNPATLNGNFKLSDASIGFKTFDIGTVGTRTIAGAFTGSSNYSLIIPNNGSVSYLGLNLVNSATTKNDYPSLEYTQIDRETNNNVFIDGVSKFNHTPTGISPSFFILARNANGTPDVYGDQGLSMISFGASKRSSYDAIKAIV